MPKITGRVYDIGLSGSRGTMWLSAGFRTGTDGVVAPRRVPYAIVGGELPDNVIVEPGPAYLEIDVGMDAHNGWPVNIPETDVSLKDLISEVYDWSPTELSLFAQMRIAAEDAAQEAATLAGEAGTAKGAAEDAAAAAALDRVHVDSIRALLDEAAENNVAPYLTPSALNATYADKATQTTVSTGRLSTSRLDSAYAPRARTVLSSLIPTDGTGRPLWTLPLMMAAASAFPPGGEVAWYGPNSRTTTNSPVSRQPVVAGVRYRLAVWARANQSGSRIFIDCENQSGGSALASGGINAPSGSRYLVHGLQVPTTWTHYESEIVFTTATTEVALTSILWNHSSGSITNATQWLAGLRLEPILAPNPPQEPLAWSGTQPEFDALGAKNPNRSYYIMGPTKAMYRGDTLMWRAT